MLASVAESTPPAALMRLMERGAALLAEGRAAESLELLQRAASVPDAPALAHGLLAEALEAEGRLDEALLAADRAVRSGEGAPPWLRARARIRRALGQSLAGLDDAAAAVMADPSDIESKSLLGICLSEAGRHDEALLLLHQAFSAEPGSAQRAAMLGFGFLRAGRHAAAEEVLGLAEAMAPQAPGIAALRAQNALAAGEPERAIAIAEAAVHRCAADVRLFSVLGQARQRLGQDAAALDAYAAALRLDPGSGYLRHLVAALGGDAAPARADGRYVAEVFDGYASRFEASLFALGYRVPGMMLRMIERARPEVAAGRAKLGPVLDLGCGTGLMGATLHDLLGDALVGVDMSSRMIEEARAKGVYTRLDCLDIEAALRAEEGLYDVILLADVLCYFGELAPLLRQLRARLAPGGLLLLSVEAAAPEARWTLARSGRYAHGEAYLRAALAEAGLVAREFRSEPIRWEGEDPVQGHVVCAMAGG
ncbi:MAG: methyltransferase domain-containing protein [Roseococcus sp.]|nr:methyltransferase domain-containing protein [Roseococcus sp.]